MDKKIISSLFKDGQQAAKAVMADAKERNQLIANVAAITEENREILKDYWQAITAAFSLLQDYFNGTYDNIPITTIILIIMSFIFVVSPVRVSPKWLPLGSFMERILVVVIILEYVKDDLKTYSNWKINQNEETDSI